MADYTDIISRMKDQGINFLDHVSSEQLDRAQERYGIRFPEELRRFYSQGMPVSQGFVNWLEETPEYTEHVKKKLRSPVRGALIAVELEELWPLAWGERPEEEAQALEQAGRRLKEAACLIPLYSHRYMACLPEADDSPILSVYGGDIIYYGAGLKNWLEIEFCGLPRGTIFESALPEIPGWQDLIG